MILISIIILNIIRRDFSAQSCTSLYDTYTFLTYINYYSFKKSFFVLSAIFLSLSSSAFLYFKFLHFLMFLSLSKDIGSSTRDDKCLTLLMATYVRPRVASDFPISVHDLCKVNPWLLWIVNAHASLSGSCCLSCIEFPECTDIVTGTIGTKEGITDIEGPM